jgi:bifunctional non-homologous end joining protein LigD
MRGVPITHADLCHPLRNPAPFRKGGWIFELKHDGFRVLANSGTRVQVTSRWGRPRADAFPEIGAALARLPDAVLDGELVVPAADGRSDFEELRRRTFFSGRA